MPKTKDRRSKDISPEPDAPMQDLPGAGAMENWRITWPGKTGTHPVDVFGALTLHVSGSLLFTDAKGSLLAVQFGSGAMAHRIDPKPLAPKAGEGEPADA